MGWAGRLGSNLQQAPNVWLDGAKNGVTGTANMGIASSAGALMIAQPEFYADPLDTGVTRRFVFPNEADELRLCQRYWYRGYGARGVMTNTDRPSRMTIKHPVDMRVGPTLAIVGTQGIYSTVVTANAIGIVGNEYQDRFCRRGGVDHCRIHDRQGGLPVFGLVITTTSP